MSDLAFIVSGIEQSEESRIYQFRAATPAEATAEEAAVPERFRFEQVINPELELGEDQLYIENGIAIDPYGCVTIPTDTIKKFVEGLKHGELPILVTIQGENDKPFFGTIQLEDYTPLEFDPVPATKVGDAVIFSYEEP